MISAPQNKTVRGELEGLYKFTKWKRGEDGELVKTFESDWMKNRILDSGLNRFGAVGNFMPAAYVGSDNTPPNDSQTWLGGAIAGTSTRIAENAGFSDTDPNYFRWVRYTYRFGEGAAAGNLSEVGVGWPSGSLGVLFSRALIVDGGGNPTTITVLPNEFLDVTYELRIHYNPNDVTGSVTINGVNYTLTVRPMLVGDLYSLSLIGRYDVPLLDQSDFGRRQFEGYTGDLAPINSEPGGYIGPFVKTRQTYVNNSYKLKVKLFADLTEVNNPAGIKTITAPLIACQFQIRFNPPLMKDNTKRLTLFLEYSWGRRA